MADVQAFAVEWYRRSYPGGAIDRRPPTVQNVQTYIAWSREAAPAQPEPTRVSDSMILMAEALRARQAADDARLAALYATITPLELPDTSGN